jgi:hypothetical protein
VPVGAHDERRLFKLDPEGPPVSRNAAALLAGNGGVLVGAIVDDAVRTWVSSPTGELTLLIWPWWYRARFGPLEVLDDNGQVVARGGEHVSLGGAHLVKRPDPRSLGHEHAFYISTVGDQRA